MSADTKSLLEQALDLHGITGAALLRREVADHFRTIASRIEAGQIIACELKWDGGAAIDWNITMAAVMDRIALTFNVGETKKP